MTCRGYIEEPVALGKDDVHYATSRHPAHRFDHQVIGGVGVLDDDHLARMVQHLDQRGTDFGGDAIVDGDDHVRFDGPGFPMWYSIFVA